MSRDPFFEGHYAPDGPDYPDGEPDDLTIPEPDFDCEPESWKKCGACPTMIPNLGIGIAKPGHRTLNGNELCSECSDLVTDAEQEAAEYERTCAEHAAEDARYAFRAWMDGGHA